MPEYYHTYLKRPSEFELDWDEIFDDETLAFEPKQARDPREAKRREWRSNESKFTRKSKGNGDVS